MSHNFPGSNNINLFILMPITDLNSCYVANTNSKITQLGKSLSTKLNPICSLVFPEIDNTGGLPKLNPNLISLASKYLDGCQDCGRLPRWFLPVVPMILIKGTDIRVMGRSVSYVPNYNPIDVIDNLRRLLLGKQEQELKPMVPWFKGFKGSVEACSNDDDTKFVVSGVFGVVDTLINTVDVTVLPIGMLLHDYDNLLNDGSIPNQGYVDLSDGSDQSLCLRITLLDEDFFLGRKQLLQRLKLTTIISLDAMYLIDDHGMTHKYDSPLEVIKLFYFYRLCFYETRQKDAMDKNVKDAYLLWLNDLDRLEKCLTEHESMSVAAQERMDLVSDQNGGGNSYLG